MTTAREIMHKGARCIPEHETLDRAAQLMQELNVGALPICDDSTNKRLLGILTDRDIVVKCIAKGKNPSKVTAGDLAQGTPRWIDASADVNEALELMKQHQIRRLPVIENKKVIGMISEADISHHLSDRQVHEFTERIYASVR